mgnify:CR=1 FL=1|jgi:hypothetical protein
MGLNQVCVCWHASTFSSENDGRVFLCGQDAETVRQRRSRIVQILNVPQRVRLRSSLAVALLDSLFEHPANLKHEA